MLRTVLLLGFLTCLPGLLVSAQTLKAVSVAQKVNRPALPDTYTGRQLIVGSGGGFTGLTTTYYLLDNGRLYSKRSRETSYQLIGTQKAATTKRVFTTAEEQCQIKTTRFNKPGNVSRFIGWRKGKQSYQVTWAAGDSTIPANYPKFYNAFMAMIPATVRSN